MTLSTAIIERFAEFLERLKLRVPKFSGGKLPLRTKQRLARWNGQYASFVVVFRARWPPVSSPFVRESSSMPDSAVTPRCGTRIGHGDSHQQPCSALKHATVKILGRILARNIAKIARMYCQREQKVATSP